MKFFFLKMQLFFNYQGMHITQNLMHITGRGPAHTAQQQQLSTSALLILFYEKPKIILPFEFPVKYFYFV